MNMNRNRILYVLLCCCLVCLPLTAHMTYDGKRPVYDKLTDTYLLTLPDSVFGHPYNAAAVIDDTVSWVRVAGKTVWKTANFPIVNGDTTYTVMYAHNGRLSEIKLRFTSLPILCMDGTFDTEYKLGQVRITMPDDTTTQHYQARIKWAGGTTTYDWINKHNYHIKFVDENLEKMDVSFFGLRNDNHWRLDAGIIDMLRYRNKAAHGLWADFGNKPYYADAQPNARSYSRGNHVEVFLNGEYMGFFDLHEFLDRKQMKLKKYDEVQGKFHGLMWKGKDETEQTMFIASKPVDNTVERWGGFDIMYPDLDDVSPTNYDVLADAISFVAESDSLTFVSKVADRFDLPILADYYVFINVLFAIDNTCKNIIWSCYDCAQSNKLTLSVWDLEATVGQHWYDGDGFFHAEEIGPENDLDQYGHRFSKLWLNRLFMRLRQMPEFNEMVKTRYWELRRTILQPDSLIARYATIHNNLERSGAINRETERWSGDRDLAYRPLDFDAEFDYMSDWIVRRIAYLDSNTFAVLRGDVNGDGEVNIRDASLFIDYLLNDENVLIMKINSDVNMDFEVSIKDLSWLIDMLLEH